MASPLLDFKKFKHVKSDDKTTTLRHQDGHELTLHHKALSKDNQKQLQAMAEANPKAEGGEASPSPGIIDTVTNAVSNTFKDDFKPKSDRKVAPADPDKAKAMSDVFKAEGGKVKMYADPEEPVSKDDSAPEASVDDVLNQSKPQQNMSQPPVSININAQPSPTPTPAPPTVQPQQFSMNDIQQGLNKNQQATAPAQSATQAEAPAPANPLDSPAQPNQAPKEPEQAKAPEVDANGELPDPDEADAKYAAQPEQPKTPEQHAQAVASDALGESDAFRQDIADGHITPETYSSLFEKKDTLGKIGTIFGMLFSGLGSGLSHQPNALLTLMQKQIDNDLQAQVQSKSNAQNMYKLQLQHQLQEAQIPKLVAEGKLTTEQAKLTEQEAKTKAFALSKMNSNWIAADKATKLVQQLPEGSPERQKAEAALSLMFQGINTDNYSISTRLGAASALANPSNSSNNGPEQNTQNKIRSYKMAGFEPLAKDLEDKHFPGIKGQATVPLSSGDRDAINSGVTFDKQLSNFIDWTKGHSGDLNPKDKKEGQAMAAELQGAYRQATHGGVFKEGEQNFISKLIDDDPTKFFNEIRVLPSLKAIQNTSRGRLDQLVKSKGFQGYQPQSNTSSSAPSQAQPSTSKSGRPIEYRNGKAYYK